MSPIRSSNFWDIFLWLLKQRQRLRVVGVSMLPMLQPGDEVLVDRLAYRRSLPALGDIVIIQPPDRPDIWSIKRVVSVQPNGACFVQGDNILQSTDSRAFGPVASHLILGRVTSRFF